MYLLHDAHDAWLYSLCFALLCFAAANEKTGSRALVPDITCVVSDNAGGCQISGMHDPKPRAAGS